MRKFHKTYHLPQTLPVLNGKISLDREFISIKVGKDKLMYFSNSGKWEALCKVIYLAPHCKICSNPKPPDIECTAHKPRYEKLDKTIAIGEYYSLRFSQHNKLSKLIRSFKNKTNPVSILAPVLAFVLESELSSIGPKDIDYFTFVPERKEEYKEGEGVKFNQSRLLTRCLKNFIDRPVLNLFVKQSSGSFKGKGQGIRRIFARTWYDLNPQKNCKKFASKNIAIVDDLRTSGATGNRFATLLKKECKVGKVFLLVAGRSHWKRKTR